MKNFFYPDQKDNIGPAIGGKGENLFLLGRDFNIPDWVAVPVDIFNQFLESSGLNKKIRSKIDGFSGKDKTKLAGEIQGLILAEPLNSEIINEITELAEQRFANVYISVRSSAADEDSASHSFAGIHTAFYLSKALNPLPNTLKKSGPPVIRNGPYPIVWTMVFHFIRSPWR